MILYQSVTFSIFLPGERARQRRLKARGQALRAPEWGQKRRNTRFYTVILHIYAFHDILRRFEKIGNFRFFRKIFEISGNFPKLVIFWTSFLTRNITKNHQLFNSRRLFRGDPDFYSESDGCPLVQNSLGYKSRVVRGND